MPFRLGDPRHVRELAQFDPANLPAEIFSKIISITLQPIDQMYTHMFPLSLASVNRSWRAFLLDSPRIWASLCVDLSSSVPMDGVQIFLERSRSFPLDIVLYNPKTVGWPEEPPAESPLVTALMRALDPHQGRWRSFKLHLSSHSALCIAIAAFRGVAESLEELIIDGHGRIIDLPRTPRPEFRMAMPAIEHLQITGNAASWLIREVKWVTKMHGLTSLTFRGPDHDVCKAAFSTFIRDISAESTLEVLEFNDDWLFQPARESWAWGSSPSYVTTPKLQLPRLKEVRFNHTYFPNLADEIMIYFEAPNLEILDFFIHPNSTAWDRNIMGWFPSFSSSIKRLPKLRTFRLMGPPSIYIDLGPIESCENLVVSGIHGITTMLDHLGKSHDIGDRWALGHEDITNSRALRLANSPPPSMRWYCPRLLSLEIYHCDGLDPAQLRNMLEARKNAAGLEPQVNAISSLIVHDERKLSGEDRAWFEARLVAFEWIRCDRPPPPTFPAPPAPPELGRPSWREVWY